MKGTKELWTVYSLTLGIYTHDYLPRTEKSLVNVIVCGKIRVDGVKPCKIATRIAKS